MATCEDRRERESYSFTIALDGRLDQPQNVRCLSLVSRA